LEGEVDDCRIFNLVCLLLKVLNDMRALIKILTLVLVLIERVDVLVGFEGGVGPSEVEANSVLDAAPAEEDI
jgi:hypothetical protein